MSNYNHDAIVDKISKLRELVIFSMVNYKSHPDYIWSCRMLDDVKESGLVPRREEFIMANLIWKKPSSFINTNQVKYGELLNVIFILSIIHSFLSIIYINMWIDGSSINVA